MQFLKRQIIDVGTAAKERLLHAEMQQHLSELVQCRRCQCGIFLKGNRSVTSRGKSNLFIEEASKHRRQKHVDGTGSIPKLHAIFFVFVFFAK